MKKIILVRHAQSPIEYTNIIDFDRPLNNKGVLEAGLMSNKIKKYINRKKRIGWSVHWEDSSINW